MKLISRSASSLPLILFAEVVSYQKVLSARFNSSLTKNPSGLFELHFIMIGGLGTTVVCGQCHSICYLTCYLICYTEAKKKKIEDEALNLFLCVCVRATVRERKSFFLARQTHVWKHHCADFSSHMRSDITETQKSQYIIRITFDRFKRFKPS